MRQRKIKKVLDNMNKHQTYQELNKRKIRAFEKEDYLSVIHYSYAMIEDRLLSILHYLYIIDRDKYPYKLEAKIEESLTELLYPSKDSKKSSPQIENINTKITIIKKIYNYKKDDKIINSIKEHLNLVIDIKSLKKDISDLKKWKDYRNEFTHSLYNKDLEDINIKQREQAQIGIDLSDKFDKYSDLLKGNINNVPSLRSRYEKIV